MLHGRDTEHRVLDELLSAVMAGHSGALVVLGEPGIGKTTLLDYAAKTATSEGARVLRGSGVEFEAELPFAGLQLLLRPALRHLDALPEAQAAALRSALGLAPAGGGDQFLIGLAVLSLLARLAEDKPLVCLVDDAQWLDRATVETLLFAARRLAEDGVLLVFGARSHFSAHGLPELELTGLDASAATALLAEHADDLTPQLRYRLLAEAGGNPLALIELPAALGDADSALDTHLPLTEKLRATFSAQLDRLPDATRWLLLIAAAEDTGDLAIVLSAAAGFGATVADLRPAELAGLVVVADGTVGFRHPLVRTATYQGAPLADRLALHQALAGALSGPEHADRHAWHLATASTGPDEAVAEELERTATRAGSRHGHTAAATAYERAAQLSPAVAERARRLVLAAEAAAEAGEVSRARSLAVAVTEPPEDPELRARLVQVDALARFAEGRAGEAHRLLLDAANLAGLGQEQSLDLLLAGSYFGWFAGRRELVESLDRLTALRLEPDGARGAMARLLVAAISVLLDRDVAPADLAALGEQAGLHADAPHQLLLVCGLELATGQDAAVLSLARRAVTEARADGRIARLPNLLFLLAEAQLAVSLHRDALASATEGNQIAEDTGQHQWRGMHAGVLAYLMAIEGDDTRCRDLADSVLAAPDGPGTHRAIWALGVLDLGRGRAAAALARLATLAESPSGYGVAVTRSVPDLVEAAVRLGEPARAGEAFDRFTTRARSMRQAWADALVARCRALLGPEQEAEHHFTAALSLHGKDRRPFEQARTELLYGEWLRRARRKAEASTHLRSAKETFERLQARPWLERVEGELGATGVTGSGGGHATLRGPLAQLTPQELQIVRLAATGLSNRDIAAQLFLSPRTVGHHLYKAYPKLGVQSRAELAGLTLRDPAAT
ncbi:ATP-binding protein [Amycolatopsis regifaucium]|uniref:Transcriptional regulator n=1 Tax=Amycolatopsis regifaucium TaxID=546365 RepID=A0A154M4E2_9PSEU|nr:AAA family ATPase [Amycolatopsis regifaucium]KZB79227.1 transcriptional regulator [Amycolatopsis regifaucium]OKA07410.1 helix-turn-helix transcriptional regulator [Amycolatopsis regifaucium]SFH12087.1 regulatory protein, luxR family [Amycolatopsis regifaucium]